jgi:membrane-associated phospholipid phosphatase
MTNRSSPWWRAVAAALTLAIIVWAGSAAPVRAGSSELRETGDVLQIALPVTAFLSTYLYDDPEGRAQFSKAFLTSWTTTYAIKTVGNKVRPGDIDPEEEGNLSFPSGHTMGAFAGASFLQTRYGWVWGLPAYFLAGLTGYSRIDAEAHYFDDVIAGASISMLSNWYYATEHPKKFYIRPRVGSNAYGMEFQIPMEGDKLSQFGEKVDPKWHFSLFMGPSWPGKADAKAPSGSGTQIDLTEFDDDFILNAFVSAGRFFGKRHDLQFKLMPMEKRQNGVFGTDVDFAGQTFAANELVRTRYRLNEWHLRYRYALLPDNPWDFNVGIGLGYFDAKVSLTSLEDGREASADEWYLLPMAHLSAGYRFNPRWRVSLGTDFYYDTDNWHDEFSALVHYRADPNWVISAGYRGWAGRVDESDLDFEYAFHGLTIGFSYLFF